MFAEHHQSTNWREAEKCVVRVTAFKPTPRPNRFEARSQKAGPDTGEDSSWSEHQGNPPVFWVTLESLEPAVS